MEPSRALGDGVIIAYNSNLVLASRQLVYIHTQAIASRSSQSSITLLQLYATVVAGCTERG